MTRPLKICGTLLASLALIMMIGMQWNVLQLVAWGGMLVTYTSESGLESGLRETFDGAHPCSLCTAIQEAKTQDAPDKKWTASPISYRLVAVASPCTPSLMLHRPDGATLSSLIPPPPNRLRDPPPHLPPRRMA